LFRVFDCDVERDNIEQAGHGAAGLVALREAQLAAVRHAPQLRGVALDVAAALGVALAFLTGFALANSAAASALSGPLPGWAALLLLAVTWIAIAILLVFALNRGNRVFHRRQLRMLGADVAQTLSAREQARDEAQQGMRESLERLAGGVGDQSAVVVSSAVVPVAGGAVSAGEHLIDEIDEITDDLGDAVPGGHLINWAADMALVPGRYFINVARTALKGREPPGSAEDHMGRPAEVLEPRPGGQR
jgi:hypothetical protein